MIAGRPAATIALYHRRQDLPPEPGVHATFAREHEYKRYGTVSLLAGIDSTFRRALQLNKFSGLQSVPCNRGAYFGIESHRGCLNDRDTTLDAHEDVGVVVDERVAEGRVHDALAERVFHRSDYPVAEQVLIPRQAPRRRPHCHYRFVIGPKPSRRLPCRIGRVHRRPRIRLREPQTCDPSLRRFSF
jgi:hypothetical protein